MPCAKYPRDFLFFRAPRLPGLGVILGAISGFPIRGSHPQITQRGTAATQTLATDGTRTKHGTGKTELGRCLFLLGFDRSRVQSVLIRGYDFLRRLRRF